MKTFNLFLILGLYGIILSTWVQCTPSSPQQKEVIHSVDQEEDILSYEVDLSNSELQFFYKNEKGTRFTNHKKLKEWLSNQNQELLFAMNGGMYKKDGSPQGLYIEKGKLISPLDTIEKAFGNFYLQPNGVFYLSKNKQATICTSDKFNIEKEIIYATQSGPMLVIDGNLHPAFNEGSKSVHIRNGVGVLPNGNLLFAMSKEKVNFFRFASFFKKNNCKQALYLDGFVSRTYLPSQNWKQEDGNFSVIIAEIKTNVD